MLSVSFSWKTALIAWVTLTALPLAAQSISNGDKSCASLSVWPASGSGDSTPSFLSQQQQRMSAPETAVTDQKFSYKPLVAS
jgi:hypothetical protein